MMYPKMQIADITVGERHRKELGDVESLAQSMQSVGQINPVTLDSDKNLICGLRRIRAAMMLGWSEIEYKIVDTDKLLQTENDENEVRKEFTPSERVAIAQAIKDKIGDRRKNREEVPEILEGERARDLVARVAGFSSATNFRQAQKVVENGAPETVEAMDAGIISIGDAANIAQEEKVVQQEAVQAVITKKTETATQAVQEIKDPVRQQDPSGNPWPEHILPAIEANRVLNKFRVTIASLIEEAEIIAQGPMKVHIDWSEITDKLDQVRKSCLTGSLGYLCPYCRGNGKAGERTPCRPCKSSGWVTAKIWKDSPAAHDMGEE